MDAVACDESLFAFNALFQTYLSVAAHLEPAGDTDKDGGDNVEEIWI